MKVNAWVCARATDSDLESGLGEATVILNPLFAVIRITRKASNLEE